MFFDDYSEIYFNLGWVILWWLNCYEYVNFVWDLFVLDVDIVDVLFGDDLGYGFDNNVDVLSMFMIYFECYLYVVGKVSKLVVGVIFVLVMKIMYVVFKDGLVKNSGIFLFDLRMSDDLLFDFRGGGSFLFYVFVIG